MILKGNQRGGGRQLAAHLLNEFDNERKNVVEIRGAIANDIDGALDEWAAQAAATTKIKKKFYYHLSISPDQSQGRLTLEQYFELIDRAERGLNMAGQPRAVVFHEKRDKDGVPREHCHVVWSRVDMRGEKIKAVDIAHDRLKLRTIVRGFARDHGLELPDGMKRGKRRENKKQFEKEDLGERQQKERTGIGKAQRMADIATAWKETSGGIAFIAALEKKGYFLASGDARAYVVVDLHGEVHSLSRDLKGTARGPDIKTRLKELADKLPGVEAAQAWAKKQRDKLEKQSEPEKPAIDKRIADLRARQQRRRDDMDKERITMLARHIAERDGLKQMQFAEISGVVSARLAKQRKGFMAFLTRITGIQALTDRRQRREDVQRDTMHDEQKEALKRRHDREIKAMDRHFAALDRLDTRENKAVDTALKREAFQRNVQQMRLPPDTMRDFTKAAKEPLDLTAAFNREVERRVQGEKDGREPDGPDRDLDRGRKR